MLAILTPHNFHGIHCGGVFNIRSQYCFIPKFTTKVCSAHFSLMSKQRIGIKQPLFIRHCQPPPLAVGAILQYHAVHIPE